MEESPSPKEKELPRIFVVGLGQTGREFISQLRGLVRLVGIDLDQEKLSRLRKQVGEELELVLSDGTSRLTWERLGLKPEDTVVAICGRDDINLEVCRVVKEYFGVKRRLAVSVTAEREEEYQSAGIEVITRWKALAGMLKNLLFQDHRVAVEIGLGKGEIIETTILPGSPAVGKTVGFFRARSWRIGAVYRAGELLLPQPELRLQAKDKILLIGDARILPGIAEFFRMGEPEFPLQFGSRIALLPWLEQENIDQLLKEANYFGKFTKARSLLIFSRPEQAHQDQKLAESLCSESLLRCYPAWLEEPGSEEWLKMLRAQDVGLVLLPEVKQNWLRRVNLLKSFVLELINRINLPVLISRGTIPYQRILLPVIAGSNLRRLTELAIDVARQFEARLEALTVTEPSFSIGQERIEEEKRALHQVEELCSLYRLPVITHHREGNPIREISLHSRDYQLLIIGHRRRRWRLPRIDVAMEIISRAPCSVMVFPFEEER